MAVKARTSLATAIARYCWEAVALFRGGTDPSLR
jgi:hypothetical protein